MLYVATFIKFILRATFCLSFHRHEKVLAILLPHGRCYMLLHLLNSFCVTHFAGFFPHEKVLTILLPGVIRCYIY